MLYTLLGIIVFIVIVYQLFINFYPSFGGNISEERRKIYSKSKQFKNGVFQNKIGRISRSNFRKQLRIAYRFFFEKVENGRPEQDLPVKKLDSIKIADYKGSARLFWYGHSAFLLQIDGKNILLDPMFGKVAAPLEWMGSNRFNSELPLEIEKLPQIDAILFSHDHYDHLDYKSVIKLKDKTEHFFVPLGVGVHLEAWGVPKNKITELDWWQNFTYKQLELVCTPAQHFSGRKIGNMMNTLWSSWVIMSKSEHIFFSGDGGYASHFKEIGNKYGPFDIALMECGQYNKMWKKVHMTPEETAQAGIDIKAKKLIPIHWAGFKLAFHSWTDPITRVKAKAKELNLNLVTPLIGEEVIVRDSTKIYADWWNLEK